MGYAFAWRPTHEGTVKKGIQRIIGTCLGGFCGWLGVIVCSWSYDNDAEINPYGLIAWLTISTTLGAYFVSLGSGISARMGKDQDDGYVGMYFSMTQALIALEVFLGAGDKSGLTLNRIVATVTGVIIAILISALPPHANGRDPKYTRAYLDELNSSFVLLLKTFADEQQSSKITSEEFQKSLLSLAHKKRSFAVFLLNDADMLQCLPFMKVNPDLRPLLDSLAVIEASIYHLLNGFATVISEDRAVNDVRTSVQAFVQDVLVEGAKLSDERPYSDFPFDITVHWTYDIAYELSRAGDFVDRIESECRSCAIS